MGVFSMYRLVIMVCLSVRLLQEVSTVLDGKPYIAPGTSFPSTSTYAAATNLSVAGAVGVGAGSVAVKKAGPGGYGSGNGRQLRGTRDVRYVGGSNGYWLPLWLEAVQP